MALEDINSVKVTLQRFDSISTPAPRKATLRLVTNDVFLNMNVMLRISCQSSTLAHAEKQIRQLVLQVWTAQPRAAQRDRALQRVLR